MVLREIGSDYALGYVIAWPQPFALGSPLGEPVDERLSALTRYRTADKALAWQFTEPPWQENVTSGRLLRWRFAAVSVL